MHSHYSNIKMIGTPMFFLKYLRRSVGSKQKVANTGPGFTVVKRLSVMPKGH